MSGEFRSANMAMHERLAKVDELREAAAKGDEQARRELIAECRRGMLEPEWERR